MSYDANARDEEKAQTKFSGCMEDCGKECLGRIPNLKNDIVNQVGLSCAHRVLGMCVCRYNERSPPTGNRLNGNVPEVTQLKSCSKTDGSGAPNLSGRVEGFA